jgi:hypothetical protein
MPLIEPLRKLQQRLTIKYWRRWRGYQSLFYSGFCEGIEAVFRCFKSELGLRPIFHHKEVRADGHLFITVLAYQFAQLIRRRLHA